jgi:hypothetical protein
LVAADLDILRSSLQATLTGAQTAHRAVTAVDTSPIGAKPLVDAFEEFARARAGDLMEFGKAMSELAKAAAEVDTVMTAVDDMLGG